MDEKSQVQALERTQPVLSMGLGYVKGVTPDYFSHGTTTLFAASTSSTAGSSLSASAPSPSRIPELFAISPC